MKIAHLLPAGWTYLVPVGDPDQVVLTSPDRMGSVTVDFKNRGFRGGFCTVGRFADESVTRTGRGWREKLVADAIAHLTKILK